MSVQKDVQMVSEWTAPWTVFVTHRFSRGLRAIHQARIIRKARMWRKGQVLLRLMRVRCGTPDQAKGQLAQAEAALGKAHQD